MSMLAPTPTLGVEATLGNKEESLVGQVGDKQVLSTESVTGGINTSNITKNIQEVPIEFMLLMVLGWLLPSPKDIWGGICSGVFGIVRGFRYLITGEYNASKRSDK